MKTVDRFVKFFKSIPDKQWCVGISICQGKNRQMCAVNNVYNRYKTHDPHAAMRRLTDLFLKIEGHLMTISDGRDCRYKQKTPKARVLAALSDIKSIIAKEKGGQ